MNITLMKILVTKMNLSVVISPTKMHLYKKNKYLLLYDSQIIINSINCNKTKKKKKRKKTFQQDPQALHTAARQCQPQSHWCFQLARSLCGENTQADDCREILHRCLNLQHSFESSSYQQRPFWSVHYFRNKRILGVERK